MRGQWDLERQFLWAYSRILTIVPSSVFFFFFPILINIIEENASLSDLQIGQGSERSGSSENQDLTVA